MKTIQLKSISVDSLKNFIKKMKVLSESFFMTYSKGVFKSHMADDPKKGQKVKFVEISLDELEIVKEGEVINEKAKSIESLIRFSFKTQKHLSDALSFFKNVVNVSIQYEESEDYNFATKMILTDDFLKLEVKLHPDLTWNQISSEIKEKVLAEDGKIFNFILKEESIKKLKDLCSISNQEYYGVKVIENKSIFYKDNFEIVVDVVAKSYVEDENTTIKFMIKTLDYLDVSDYEVLICKNKAIFKSLNSNSIIVIAKAIINEE